MQKILLLLLVLTISTISLIPLSLAQNNQQASPPSPPPPLSSEGRVYIVSNKYDRGVDPESHYLTMLSSVLGSKEAAKKSLLYVYKYERTGFRAVLTTKQASDMKKQPGVWDVRTLPKVKVAPKSPDMKV